MKLLHIILIMCFSVIIKCEWVEITQVTMKTAIQNSAANTPIMRRVDEDVTESSSDWNMSTQPPVMETTDKEELQVTLEGTRLSTSELTTQIPEELDPPLTYTDSQNIQMRNNMDEGVDMLDTPSAYYINNTSTSNNGFISFMNTIQNSLVSKAKNTFNSKMKVLKTLRDNLLYEIQERMDKLWKVKEVSREARGHYEEDDHHHMKFPSNEGALMTISFLTFAVYLIKLVMKLIYALKNKTQTVSTTVTPTGTGIIIGRRKRDASFEEANSILQMIEEYSLI